MRSGRLGVRPLRSERGARCAWRGWSEEAKVYDITWISSLAGLWGKVLLSGYIYWRIRWRVASAWALVGYVVGEEVGSSSHTASARKKLAPLQAHLVAATLPHAQLHVHRPPPADPPGPG